RALTYAAEIENLPHDSAFGVGGAAVVSVRWFAGGWPVVGVPHSSAPGGCAGPQRSTRAPPPPASLSTSALVTIEVSSGVVFDRAGGRLAGSQSRWRPGGADSAGALAVQGLLGFAVRRRGAGRVPAPGERAPVVVRG